MQTRLGSRFVYKKVSQTIYRTRGLLTSLYNILIKSIRIEIIDAIQFPVLLTTLHDTSANLQLERTGTVTETLTIMCNRKLGLIEWIALRRNFYTKEAFLSVHAAAHQSTGRRNPKPGRRIRWIWIEPLIHRWGLLSAPKLVYVLWAKSIHNIYNRKQMVKQSWNYHYQTPQRFNRRQEENFWL